MELPAKYDPALTEDKWYAYWLENKFFHSEPDEREPYTVVIPPPNVTGILHMGHVLNNTLNDVLVRKARMDGKNACWVPGEEFVKKVKEKLLTHTHQSQHEKIKTELDKHLYKHLEKRDSYKRLMIKFPGSKSKRFSNLVRLKPFGRTGTQE